jgi:CDP-glucose 4,6-dehydratase
VEGLGLSSAALVTGGDGLVGAWLVKALLERGERVVVIRRGVRAQSTLALLGLAESVEIVHGDICDDGFVARVLDVHDIDSVFHLAAQTLVGDANRAPQTAFETNIRGSWLVLEACRRHEVERVLVASTDKAYGLQPELPYREEHALIPRFPYDVSKAACDMIARSYGHTFGLPVAVTRLANVYGPGELHSSRLVPEAVCAALTGERPIVRSDGSPERDFLYAEDAARAYLAVWGALGDGQGAGEAFNAGGGRPHRVLDVIELICRLAGAPVAPEVRGDGVPHGELDRQWLDSSKLRALTGWRPLVTLEEGLQRTIEWYREHPVAWTR